MHEVLDPTYSPGSEPEQQELFEAKQTLGSMSLMLTIKLTWVRPLSEDTRLPLMLNQSGESLVSI